MTYFSSWISRIYSELIFLGVLFLFFFQLISDFVEAIYARELLSLSLDENVLFVLFLFSPFLLIFIKKNFSKLHISVFGGGTILMRILEPLFTVYIKLFLSGLGVGCFLIFLPAYYQLRTSNEEENVSLIMGLSLVLAVTISILFRTFGSSLDISSSGEYQVFGWILALIALLMLIGFLLKNQFPNEVSYPKTSVFHGKTFLVSLGLTSILILIYFSLVSPTVISRWTEGDYRIITSLLTLTLGGFGVFVLLRPQLLTQLSPRMIWLWNGIFVIALVSVLLIHQITFPTSLGAFPFYAPQMSFVHQLPLFIMVLLSPVIFFDFILLSRVLFRIKPSVTTLALSFTLSMVFFLLMIFAQIFTTTYDYIPLVGPLFRDIFWLVFLIIGLVIAIVGLVIIKEKFVIDFKTPISYSSLYSFVLILLIIGTLFGLILTTPQPISIDTPIRLKIATYNIQQGYSQFGAKNLQGQLNLLRDLDADIIGLQESDIARISGGNSDAVRFFADRLNLYSYYGSKTVTGTFGIALLSKFPIQNASTFYMYSEGEQTATIEAQITVGGQTLSVFVTHLGNGGPLIQQQNILENLIEQDVVLMGDFNFEPYTEQYNITKAILNDTWLISDSATVVGATYDLSERIDHIFVSPGSRILTSQFLVTDDSDHPLYWVTFEL